MVDSIALSILGALLACMTGLMGWQALAIIKAGKSIAVLEKLLETISEDLKSLGRHDSLIAVLNSEVANLKADANFLFEKFRELEGNAKITNHRRQ